MQITTKKFIYEALIGSGKFTAIRKWRSNQTEKFKVIVPTVNIAEKFYTKLNEQIIMLERTDMNNEPNITALFWVNDIAFKEFKKAVQNEVNAIVTTYSTVFKGLGDLIEECYMREKRLNNIILLFYISQRIHLYNFKK